MVFGTYPINSQFSPDENPTHVDDGHPAANQTSLQAQPRADLDPGLTVQPGRTAFRAMSSREVHGLPHSDSLGAARHNGG